MDPSGVVFFPFLSSQSSFASFVLKTPPCRVKNSSEPLPLVSHGVGAWSWGHLLSGERYPGFLIEWIFYWIESSQIKKNLNKFLNWIFREKILLNKFFNWIFLKKIILNIPLNWILPWNEWMNHILNRYLPFLTKKHPFLVILDTFWAIFGHFSYSTSINDSLTIELNYLLNWISRIFFELNNIFNCIMSTAILNRILNESFFDKIQILIWIR